MDSISDDVRRDDPPAPAEPGTSGAAGATASAGRWPRLPAVSDELKEALRYCGLVFLAVRVGLELLAMLALNLLPANPGLSDGRILGFDYRDVERGWSLWLYAWERWDVVWYLRIMEGGYPLDDVRAAFFPVYPMLSWLFRPLVGGSSLAAAILVSNLSYYAALVLLYRLTVRERGAERAKRTVLYLATLPVGFFFIAPYTESLFLLLALGLFFAARNRRWLMAGALGAVASGTRSVGFLLAVPVALEALQVAWQAEHPRERWRTLILGGIGAALVPAGLLAYLAYWEWRSGFGLYPLRLQETWWQHVVTTPWDTLWTALDQATTGIGEFSNRYPQLDLLLVLPCLVGVVWVLRRLPLSYSMWTLASVLMPLMTPTPFRVLLSAPRYFAVVFPLTWALVAFSERFKAHELVLAVNCGLLGILTVLHVANYYIY